MLHVLCLGETVSSCWGFIYLFINFCKVLKGFSRIIQKNIMHSDWQGKEEDREVEEKKERR